MPMPRALRAPLRLPVMAAPMFIASGPELVIAQCKAGIIGSFPALNARPGGALAEWIALIRAELAAHDRRGVGHPAAPFAVNLIVHRSNHRLERDLAAVVEAEVPVVITSMGARPEVFEAVRSYGGCVLHDVTTVEFAHKAVAKGADGLIAVAAGAGGHAGTLSPFALLREIRAWHEGPLLLSGAIGDGRSVLAAQVAGADLAYVGSVFLSTHEANISEEYRQMVLDSTAADIVYSSLFSGVHANYLRGSIVAAGLDPDDLPAVAPATMDFAPDRPEAKAWRDIWGAGQGIGSVTRQQPVAALVDSLSQQYEDALLTPVWDGRRRMAAASNV